MRGPRDTEKVGDDALVTENKPIPPDLREWVEGNLPGVDHVADVSWPRGNSRVWRVSAGATVAFVKLSPTMKAYEREVRGYTFTARTLAGHETPRLLAANPGLMAIMTSPQRGKVVRGLALEAAAERRVHELAGRLLRRWHDHSDPATEQDRRAVRDSMSAQAQEAADCLASSAGHLDDAQRALVEATSQELPRLAEQLPLVYKHGDYSTRNWLWDPRNGHGLIDFAMAGHGLVVEEFVWLCGAVWVPRPDLRTAYLTGYGRPLTDIEERLLRLLTTRLGVSYLNSGLAKNRPDLIDRGRLVLNRMTHEYR